MLFVLTCIDKKNSQGLRTDTRMAHLEYLKKTGSARLGGPFLNDEGQMVGSMLVIEAADKAAAEAWVANDPYAKAGLFAKTKVRGWKPTFNPSNVTL